MHSWDNKIHLFSLVIIGLKCLKQFRSSKGFLKAVLPGFPDNSGPNFFWPASLCSCWHLIGWIYYLTPHFFLITFFGSLVRLVLDSYGLFTFQCSNSVFPDTFQKYLTLTLCLVPHLESPHLCCTSSFVSFSFTMSMLLLWKSSNGRSKNQVRLWRKLKSTLNNLNFTL